MTFAEYQSILDEFDRRSRLRSVPADYNFTSLLTCSTCGKALHITHAKGRLYWWCNGHVTLRCETANQLVGDELVRLFSQKEYTPGEAQPGKSITRKALNAVENQLRRLEQAFDAGAYTPEEFSNKRKTLLARKADLLDEEKQLEEARRQETERKQLHQTMAEILPHIHKWITDENPAIVKFHLSRVVRLTAYPDKTIQAELL